MNLLLVDKLLIFSHIIEDAGDAHELEVGLSLGRAVVDWSSVLNGTFILLNSSPLIGATILGSLDLPGSASSAFWLGVLLLRKVANCLESPMRTGSAYGGNSVLNHVYA